MPQPLAALSATSTQIAIATACSSSSSSRAKNVPSQINCFVRWSVAMCGSWSRSCATTRVAVAISHTSAERHAGTAQQRLTNFQMPLRRRCMQHLPAPAPVSAAATVLICHVRGRTKTGGHNRATRLSELTETSCHMPHAACGMPACH